MLELGNPTVCEDRAVDWINGKVVVLSLGVECEEVVERGKDLVKALGFVGLLKFQDCLDGGRGGCGILRNLQVNISMHPIESEASLMRAAALRSVLVCLCVCVPGGSKKDKGAIPCWRWSD